MMQVSLDNIYRENLSQTGLIAEIGFVDQEFVNSVLNKIKELRYNSVLSYSNYKKVYAITTELLENIKKHGQVKPEENLPAGFIIITANSQDICIISGNYISFVDENILSDFITGLNHADIRQTYRETVSTNKQLSLKGGAGIGLLDIAAKVDKHLYGTFYDNQTIGKIVKFTAKLTAMEKLFIKSEETTPEINFDHSALTLAISGESRPEDIKSFYREVFHWLTLFDNHIYYINSISPKPVTCSLIFNMTYFNSSSVKIFIQVMELYKKIEKANKNFTADIIWKYNSEDEDILEAGQEIEKMTGVKMNFVQND